MPRRRRDGAPAAAANRHKLNDLFLKRLKPQQGRAVVVWDTQQRGLAVRVQPTGHKSWKAIYSLHGRPRWYLCVPKTLSALMRRGNRLDWRDGCAFMLCICHRGLTLQVEDAA